MTLKAASEKDSGSSKAQKMNAVAKAALELLWKVGPQALTVSRLARSSGASRPWIYKYLGEDPVEILKFAVDMFARDFSEFESPVRNLNRKSWAETQTIGLIGVMRDAAQYPWIIGVYMKFKGTHSTVGAKIDEIEKRYLEKIQRETQAALGVSKTEALKIAEMTMTLKLALAHRWAIQKANAFTSIEEFAELGRTMFEGIAAEKGK